MALENLMSFVSLVCEDSASDIPKMILSVIMAVVLFVGFVFFSYDQGFFQITCSVFSSVFFGLMIHKRHDGKSQSNRVIKISKKKCRRDSDDSYSSQLSLNETFEENVPSKDTPATSEPPKKPSKKQKKKRNSLKSNKSKYKYIDDTSDTSSNPDTNSKMETYAGTNIYTPLPQYLELKLESFDLYHEFMMYLLTPDQLCKYGFPMESVDHPGHINLDPHLIRGSTERRCCRCSNIFHVLPGGQYESNTICHFHAKKQLYSGYYPCCNGNYLSEGCLTWQYHVSAESFLHDVKFVKTREKRHLNSVTASTVYAIDCEMCYTTAGLELSKIGVVSLDGLTVYETFVLPENKILDYNTVYSGVTERDLRDVSTTLIDVQTYLLKLINKESILVGHGLENDLKALRLIHSKVVDTSVAFPHKYGDKYKRSLKAIAEEYLNKSIQNSSNGHDCIEDARTCMELMLYKISSDLKLRPQALCINKNVVNKKYTVVNKKYTQISKPFVHNTWQYSCHLSYWDSQWENIPSNFMPKQYYNNYIY